MTQFTWSNTKSILIGIVSVTVPVATQYLLGQDWGDYKMIAVPIIGLISSLILRQIPKPQQ